MNTTVLMKWISIILGVGLVLWMLVKGIRARLKRETCPEYRSLKTYINIFKKGVHIVWQHKWLAVFPMAVAAVNVISRWPLLKKCPVGQFPLGESIDLWAIIKAFPRNVLFALNIAPCNLGFHFPELTGSNAFLFGAGPFSFVIFAVALGAIFYLLKKSLKKFPDADQKEIRLFLNRVLIPLITLAILLTLMVIFSFSPWHSGSIRGTLLYLFIIPVFCLSISIFSLIEGSMLYAVSNYLKEESNAWGKMAIASIRSFKALFLFNFLLVIISTSVLLFLNFILLKLRGVSGNMNIACIGGYTPLYFYGLIIALAMFIPYIIVKDKVNLRGAFRRNLQLWRRHTAKLIAFIFLCILLIFSAELILRVFLIVYRVNIGFMRCIFHLLPLPIVWSVYAISMVSTMVFYVSLEER